MAVPQAVCLLQVDGADVRSACGKPQPDVGFFFEKGQSRPVEGTVLPSDQVKAVDIKLGNGDVGIRLSDDPQGDITLDEIEANLK